MSISGPPHVPTIEAVSVLRVTFTVGNGSQVDPHREVVAIYTTEGDFVAQWDPHVEGRRYYRE